MRLPVFICICVVLLFSCKQNQDAPCRKPYTDSITLSQSIILYRINDSLIFTTENLDSVKLYVSNVSNMVEMAPKTVNPECPPDSLAYKGIAFELSNQADAKSFDMDLLLSGRYSNITFNTNNVVVKKDFSFFQQKEQFYFDTISFQGRQFTQVYQVATASDTIYLNKSQGVVHYRSGTKYWTLSPN